MQVHWVTQNSTTLLWAELLTFVWQAKTDGSKRVSIEVIVYAMISKRWKILSAIECHGILQWQDSDVPSTENQELSDVPYLMSRAG